LFNPHNDKMTTHIIPSEDFKYPSKQERIESQKVLPKISCFGFKYKSEIQLILIEKKSLTEASISANLFRWDNCLQNRFGKLSETFIYAMTNYNRGFLDDISECTSNQFINQIMFNYYAEVFYYYLFSARDVIAQIVREYYSISIQEGALHFNDNFLSKINDLKVKENLVRFSEELKDAKEYRNSFAHRFPANQPDFRSSITIKDGYECLNGGRGQYITSEKIIENIQYSLNSLFILMEELKESMN